MARKATPETAAEATDATQTDETEDATHEVEQVPVSVPVPVENAAPLSELLTAIAAATAEVKRLAKSNDNREQRYKYSSIDDFLAMTGPICAKHGLVILQQEVSTALSMKKAAEMVHFTYEFTVYHSATAQVLPPIRRTVEVYRTGAQATGAAQSYAQKTFLRGLLQIPTGDAEDPDAGHNDQPSKREQQQPQQEQRQNRRSDNWGHQQGGQRQQSQGQQAQQPPQGQQQPPKRTVQDLVNGLIAGLTKAKTLEELEAMNTDGQPLYVEWGWLEDNNKQQAADMVQQAYAEHRAKLMAQQGKPQGGGFSDLDDEIPF